MLNRRKKILLVEDDSVAAVGISLPLIRRGYKVISRSSGAALEWLRSEVPDLVILDMAMTGRLGFEVSRRIHENRATGLKPVIPHGAERSWRTQGGRGDRERCLRSRTIRQPDARPHGRNVPHDRHPPHQEAPRRGPLRPRHALTGSAFRTLPRSAIEGWPSWV